MNALLADFSTEVRRRLDDLDQEVQAGGLDPAIDLLVTSLQRGGVLQAFGTGHSQAFAMEIAGRAGGLIPTHAIVLRDVVLRGGRDVSVLQGAHLEREDSVADELYELYSFAPADVFLIASNSGVNGSIVGVALRAKAEGHPVIAVTSLEHTNAVTPKHPSGQRLSEVADVVIDNRAPYGDTTIEVPGGVGVGAVSSLTAAYIAHKSGGTKFVQGDLATPQINISYGSWYLRYLLEHYNGNVALALAAYNAGEGKVDQWWREAADRGEKFVVAKHIPFPETREYVKKVLSARNAYRHEYAHELGL